MPKTPTFYELCKPKPLLFMSYVNLINWNRSADRCALVILCLRLVSNFLISGLPKKEPQHPLVKDGCPKSWGALYGTGLYLHLLYHRHRSEKGQSWWRLMTDVSEMVRSKNVVTSSQTMMRLDDGFSRCLWFSAQKKRYVLTKCIHHRTNRQLDHGT